MSRAKAEVKEIKLLKKTKKKEKKMIPRFEDRLHRLSRKYYKFPSRLIRIRILILHTRVGTAVTAR